MTICYNYDQFLDDHYMATSKRFKQVELLAQKAIENIEKLKETGLA